MLKLRSFFVLMGTGIGPIHKDIIRPALRLHPVLSFLLSLLSCSAHDPNLGLLKNQWGLVGLALPLVWIFLFWSFVLQGTRGNLMTAS